VTFDFNRVRAIYFASAPPATTVAQSAEHEALEAMRGLQSVAQAALGYREYSPRLLDAKVKIDRSLRNAGQAPTKRAVEEALHLYLMAATPGTPSSLGMPQTSRP
jgi:hypothetical protein